MSNNAEELRKAIENLIDAKVHDALYRPGGLDRLRAHRMTGVASPDIRNAERKLEEVAGSRQCSPAPRLPPSSAEGRGRTIVRLDRLRRRQVGSPREP